MDRFFQLTRFAFLKSGLLCVWGKQSEERHARQQLALAVQWGCKDYYDDIGKRQGFTQGTFLLVIFVNLYWIIYYDWVYSCLKLKEIPGKILLGLFGTQ